MHEVRWVFAAAGVTLLAIVIRKSEVKRISVFRSGLFQGAALFVSWVAVQSLWALDPAANKELLVIWVKFVIVIYMICSCVDSEENLRLFLWGHVVGCFFLGWTAYTSYTGGRFEGFGESGLGEANAGALQLVTGIVTAGALLLAEKPRTKLLLVVLIAFIANGLVTTVSRSGFLAAIMGGAVFYVLSPKVYRKRVLMLSMLAAVLFGMLTTQSYWNRMHTIKYAGEDVQGVDTGGGRLDIIAAQWRMFEQHPMGCGHGCTAVLSPNYLDPRFLTAGGERASHNTFMTMLVDHGIPGGLLYIAMLGWMFMKLRTLSARLRGSSGFYAAVLPALGSVLAAVTVGDMFVQYPKLEVRVWFLSLLVVMLHLTAARAAPKVSSRVAFRGAQHG